MAHEQSGEKAPIVLTAGMTYAASLADLRSDIWKTLRLATGGGLPLEAMRLVRWEELRAFLGKRWADAGANIVGTLRAEIEGRLGPGAACVRYDDYSFLVICAAAADPLLGTLDEAITNDIAPKLVGILGGAGLIQVWKPVTVEEAGFGFERPGAEPDVPDAAADSAAQAPPETPAEPAKVVLTDAVFRYYPLWEVRANDVFGYLCEASWDVGGETLTEEALGERFRNPRLRLALDRETLKKAVDLAEEVAEQYGMVQILVPVHYGTLANEETAEKYVQRCNQSVWGVLESMNFEIVQPPPDFDAAGLSEAAGRIKPYGREVLLRVQLGFDRFDQVSADDIFSIGMNLRADARGEPEVITELESFAAGASARGLHCHVHGLTTATLSVAAASAGLDFIGSDAIAPPLETWEPEAETIKPLDLLKTFLPR